MFHLVSASTMTFTTFSQKGDTLYVGGSFHTINGQSNNYLRAVDLTNDALLSWNPVIDGSIECMTNSGQELFVSGFSASWRSKPEDGWPHLIVPRFPYSMDCKTWLWVHLPDVWKMEKGMFIWVVISRQ